MQNIGFTLDLVREPIRQLAGLLANNLPFPQQNIFYFIIIALSLFLASNLLMFAPPKMKESTLGWLILAGGIFYLIAYV